MDKNTANNHVTKVALRDGRTDAQVSAETLLYASKGIRYLVFEDAETMALWRYRLAALA